MGIPEEKENRNLKFAFLFLSKHLHFFFGTILLYYYFLRCLNHNFCDATNVLDRLTFGYALLSFF